MRKLGCDIMIVQISVTSSLSMSVHNLKCVTTKLEFKEIGNLNPLLVGHKGVPLKFKPFLRFRALSKHIMHDIDL